MWRLCEKLVVSGGLFLPHCAFAGVLSLRCSSRGRGGKGSFYASLAVCANLWLGAGDVMCHAACRHNRTSDAKPCSCHFRQAGLFAAAVSETKWPVVACLPDSLKSAVKDSSMRTPPSDGLVYVWGHPVFRQVRLAVMSLVFESLFLFVAVCVQ